MKEIVKDRVQREEGGRKQERAFQEMFNYLIAVLLGVEIALSPGFGLCRKISPILKPNVLHYISYCGRCRHLCEEIFQIQAKPHKGYLVHVTLVDVSTMIGTVSGFDLTLILI